MLRPSQRVAHFLTLVGLAFGCATGSAAETGACDPFNVSGKRFIYITDSEFHRLKGPTIPLGTFHLPDRSPVLPIFYVVSSRDLKPETQIGGRELSVSLRPVHQACKRVNVAAVEFSFDSSPLPPGDFIRDYAFYGELRDGTPDLATDIAQVSGHVERAWVTASLESTDKLRLTNTGNSASGKLQFDALPGDLPFTVTDNRCAGLQLQPQQSCEIMMSTKPAPSSRKEFTWDVGYKDSPNTFVLEFSARAGQISAFARNQ
jgi:hypothetical protein